jgi:cytochrome c-type biogenesis protein CcmH
MSARVVIVAALLAVAAVSAFAARPHETSAAERVDRIAAELRCPVCQALSVKDSTSDTARQMRDLVAQRVQEGRTNDEIKDEFRRSYGDWILLSPPVQSWTGLVWLAPVGLVAAGLAVAFARVRRRRPATAGGGPPTPAQLAALRERVAYEEATEG